MHRFSYMRKKLETEYLAESLRGRLTYFVTNYHNMHDKDEGRVAVRLDGAEILKSNFFDRMDAHWKYYYQTPDDPENGMKNWQEAGQKAIADGTFFQIDFYRAFAEFDSRSIAESLRSENALVRMFALLDRRTGKRTLEKLRPEMEHAPQWLKMIYAVRLEAEHLPQIQKENSVKKGILFDLDGTLWDSSAEVTEAWNTCLREKTDRPEQFTVSDMHRFMGKTLDAIAAMMFPQLSQEEQLRLIVMCEDTEQEYLTAHPAPLMPGSEEVLRLLAEQYALGIVSNCQEGYIEIYLNQCGFPELFCDFESAGKTGLSKGQNIRLVMERQGITDCVYVGDTQGDADAAAEAGVPFIHAAYGFGQVTACAAAISSPEELPAAAARILG
ncbi:MAG: HAD family hydrolase [Oscillospiraceae bacterium]|nr:HAD family hydrolase [Oscillospiraceae bacterium]